MVVTAILVFFLLSLLPFRLFRPFITAFLLFPLFVSVVLVLRHGPALYRLFLLLLLLLLFLLLLLLFFSTLFSRPLPSFRRRRGLYRNRCVVFLFVISGRLFVALLPSFRRLLPGFVRNEPAATGFYRVLPSFTEFRKV